VNQPGILLQEQSEDLEGRDRSPTDFVHRSAAGIITYLDTGTTFQKDVHRRAAGIITYLDAGTTFQKDLQELALPQIADSM
jgi:hypothetical protein